MTLSESVQQFPQADFNANGMRLLKNYHPIQGAYDEIMDEGGHVRPHWQPFMASLSGLANAEISARFADADRHLRDSGVFYRIHNDGPTGGERPWPLSYVPLIIGQYEWTQLKAGVIERAELIEGLISDSYGAGDLVARGIVPAAVIAGSAEYLRPLVGVTPLGDSYLHLYAADLGRGPDGRWWVLRDRTQAPSGAGYALENRIALSRALPEIYRSLNIERLAGFFQQFREALASKSNKEDARIGLLSPGALSETYFEHAYLARYLGLLLLEGEDLTVRDGEVFVRTVSGLRPMSVILRRLDADFADPLELNPASKLGVPGLVQAVRRGTVSLANALGSGVAESLSLMSFTPALAEARLGRALKLPNIATWWCGQPRERDYVIDNLDILAVAPAFRPTLPDSLPAGRVQGAMLSGAEKKKLKDAIYRRGADFVGQEIVKISTMPIWNQEQFTPRPFSLRLFATRTKDGWTVMPGGFCRVSDTDDVRAITMQAGGRSADVWITSDKPVEQTTLLPQPETITIRRNPGSLPSRAAENLFWMGRYMERAEATLRLARALLTRGAESGMGGSEVSPVLLEMLETWGAIAEADPALRPSSSVIACIEDASLAGSVPALLQSAYACAAVIRDRFSPDAWRALRQLQTVFANDRFLLRTEAAALEQTSNALQIIAAFSGLVQENMNRLNGWRFLEIGRRIERGIATCRFVRLLGWRPNSTDALSALLELGDSQITYKIRYLLTPTRPPVIDLLVLDPQNPRSLAFQFSRIERHLRDLPNVVGDGLPSQAERLAIRESALLRAADATSLAEIAVADAEHCLLQISEEIALRFFTHRDRALTEAEDFA